MRVDEVLSRLESLGVQFSVTIPGPNGSHTAFLSCEQLRIFITDRDAACAEYWGVTKAQYRDCLEDEFAVQCSATSSRGKRCRNKAYGASRVTPSMWLHFQGGVCAFHKEHDPAEAR